VEGMGERRVRTKASRVSVSRACLLTITIYIAASFARAAERLTVEHAIGVVSAAVKWAIPKTSARTWSKRGEKEGQGKFPNSGGAGTYYYGTVDWSEGHETSSTTWSWWQAREE
jgi:hypothetical protein